MQNWPVAKNTPEIKKVLPQVSKGEDLILWGGKFHSRKDFNKR